MAEKKSTKLCECGCGNPAPIARMTNRRLGHIKGQPTRFIQGHHRRGAGNYGFKHGYYGTKVHRCWRNMLARCYRPSTTLWHRYGGRGIKVCERWHDFENFLSDMGEPPPHASIERKNNDGDYEPHNCKWASKREQANNCSDNRVLDAFGTKRTLAQWARIAEISPNALRQRLSRGWSPERALTQTLRPDRRRP